MPVVVHHDAIGRDMSNHVLTNCTPTHQKIVVAHNFYQQAGGEDVVFAAETALLRAHGHEVVEYIADNHEVEGRSRLRLAADTIWSRGSRKAMAALLAETRPDLLHLHNTFPLISPSVYYAARDAGVPVVQTLHNYRLLCLNSLFYRDGHVCEDCLGKALPWPGVVHSCYRGSRAASGAAAAMLGTHRALGTWTKLVDRYIVLTEFARGKLIQGGIPVEKLMVKPHFVDPDPGCGMHDGGFALFVGRLSAEKGVGTLLGAWEQLGTNVPLKIAGDGPLAARVEAAATANPSIEWLGRLSGAEVTELMGRAALLVVPSECYETFGRVVIEAFARGTPVIASNLGAVPELIATGQATEPGSLFQPGDSVDLAAKITTLWQQPQTLAAMGRAARAEFEAKYTAERNYARLMEIYEEARSFRR